MGAVRFQNIHVVYAKSWIEFLVPQEKEKELSV